MGGWHERARMPPTPLGHRVLVTVRPLSSPRPEHRERLLPRPPHQPAASTCDDRAAPGLWRDARAIRGVCGTSGEPPSRPPAQARVSGGRLARTQGRSPRRLTLDDVEAVALPATTST